MIGLLSSGATGDAVAIDALTNFVVTEGYVAGFDPNRGFVVVEWTIAAPPVGGNVVPEPGVWTLLGFGLMGLFVGRRRKRTR